MAQPPQRVNASINPGFASSLRIAALENAGLSVTPDPNTALNTNNAIFLNNANVWPTLEPAMDYTAGSVILFAQEVNAEGPIKRQTPSCTCS
jgi:hypothetical protein